jgi:hypothetical protein
LTVQGWRENQKGWFAGSLEKLVMKLAEGTIRGLAMIRSVQRIVIARRSLGRLMRRDRTVPMNQTDRRPQTDRQQQRPTEQRHPPPVASSRN